MKLLFKPTILLTSLLLFGCQASKPADVPPVTMVFDHKNINQEVKMEVTVEEAGEWRVTLLYFLEKPKEFNPWVIYRKPSVKEIQQDNKLSKILGMSKDSKYVGVPAKYQVKVYDQISKKYLANETIINPDTNSYNVGRYSDLVTVNLDPGKYTINVTYLEGASTLDELYTVLEFSDSPRAK